MLKENIINGAFFLVFKSINQNSSEDLNHTLGLTLSAPGLVLNSEQKLLNSKMGLS